MAVGKEYASFRACIPLKVITVGEGTDHERDFKLYDHGPKSVRCPLVMLPPVSGTPDVFFNQLMFLGSQGFRVMAVDYPTSWTHEEWILSFTMLLDHLLLDQVHLFGASLGGFLAQLYAASTVNSQRVQSLTLINTFSDTAVFHSMPHHKLYQYMPHFLMKRMLLANFPADKVEVEIAHSVDFMVDQLDKISRTSLAVRLSLTTYPGYVEPQKISAQHIPVMVLDVIDQTALSSKVQEDIIKLYPEARVAHVKDGGDFPYLSRSQEVNMFLKLHLRPFQGTRYSAGDDFDNSIPASLPTVIRTVVSHQSANLVAS